MPVLMANCIGFCDNFLSVGKSAVWTKEGKLVGQLDDKMEGILFFDTETELIIKRNFMND
jgi:predicted amidohydrolase